MELSEFLVCYSLTSYLWLSFYNLFQNFDKLIFFANFYAAPMNLKVFVWDSPQEKLQVLRNHKKPKFGVAEKIVFFVLFILLWKIQNLISIWYYLEHKGLNYQVTTENKPKFKFLSPKIK